MRPPSERAVLLVLGAVQLVNLLDFLIVMPLGPDIAAALAIPLDELGLVSGSYTAAAALAGLLGAAVLDRRERRAALVVAAAGMALGTLASALAPTHATLLAARVVAGLCGGPAFSLSITVLIETFPPERRNRALGALMSTFPIAMVLGIPAGVELALLLPGGFRGALCAVALLAAAAAAAAWIVLPPLPAPGSAPGSASRRRGGRAGSVLLLLLRPALRRASAVTAAAMVAGFLILPNLSAFVQRNQGFPRAGLFSLYLLGGVASFVVMRFAGRLIDRVGPTPVAALSCALLTALLGAWFLAETPRLPVLALGVGLMSAISLRNVAYNALLLRAPEPGERAGFLSLQSALGHLGAAVGAGLSAHLLRSGSDGRLLGMREVAVLAMALSVILPLLMARVEGDLAREGALAR